MGPAGTEHVPGIRKAANEKRKSTIPLRNNWPLAGEVRTGVVRLPSKVFGDDAILERPGNDRLTTNETLNKDSVLRFWALEETDSTLNMTAGFCRLR